MTKFNWEQDKLTCKFDQRMDSKNSLETEKIIEEKLQQKLPEKVIFDLEDVTYVASAFLRICITMVKKIGKENFVLINTQPQVKKIFIISGLEEFLNIT